MIAYLDCYTGVSGDKFLGALLHAGEQLGTFTAEHLRAAGAALAPEARIDIEPFTNHGINAVRVNVTASQEPSHRTWRDIRRMLEEATLAERAREHAITAFSNLAHAEAVVHGCAVDDVHFHEVGAIDSIIDIVGVCMGLDLIGIDQLHSSPVATGWGTVATSHGVLPVPAPATDALLVGVPTVPGPPGPRGAAPGELTTPTGAALIKTLAESFGGPPAMVRAASGYGSGTRDLGYPNVCRITVGDPQVAYKTRTSTNLGLAGHPTDTAGKRVVLIETNIDHISPEAIGFAAEELLAAGALDVWQTPVFTKKQRIAIVLSALVEPEMADEMVRLTHELTGTLGIRRTPVDRSVAPRAHFTIESPYGTVAVKAGAGLMRPEHDDVARIARETGTPYEQVREELANLAESGPGNT